MARDPSITVTERLVRAARRWAAIDDGTVDSLHLIGDLEDAVRAYEKHHGMRPLTGRVPRRKKSKAS